MVRTEPSPRLQAGGGKVKEIVEKTGERAQLIVKEHGKAVYAHRALGEHAVHTDPGLGSRIPLHATAGKAILTNLPEKAVRNNGTGGV